MPLVGVQDQPGVLGEVDAAMSFSPNDLPHQHEGAVDGDRHLAPLGAIRMCRHGLDSGADVRDEDWIRGRQRSPE
ncbi:hypothetical protein FHR71_004164 [Methylobacterium sp. RAS18]|nr:hypothetical protein [Methylobacterium sp. RAS18]